MVSHGTEKPVACSCGLLSGQGHPNGYSEEFGGTVDVHDVGYGTAHEVAKDRTHRGYEARVYYDPGFGWAVQVREAA